MVACQLFLWRISCFNGCFIKITKREKSQFHALELSKTNTIFLTFFFGNSFYSGRSIKDIHSSRELYELIQSHQGIFLCKIEKKHLKKKLIIFIKVNKAFQKCYIHVTLQFVTITYKKKKVIGFNIIIGKKSLVSLSGQFTRS